MHNQVESKHNGTKVVFCYTLQGINGHHFFDRHCSCVTKALSLPLHFSGIDTKISFKIILEFIFRPFSLFRRCRATKSTQVCQFFFLWASASAISTPRFVGVNQSNMHIANQNTPLYIFNRSCTTAKTREKSSKRLEDIDVFFTNAGKIYKCL